MVSRVARVRRLSLALLSLGGVVVAGAAWWTTSIPRESLAVGLALLQSLQHFDPGRLTVKRSPTPGVTINDDGVILGDDVAEHVVNRVERWPFGQWEDQPEPYRIYKDLVENPPVQMKINIIAFSDEFGIHAEDVQPLFDKFENQIAPLHRMFNVVTRRRVRHRTGLEDILKKCNHADPTKCVHVGVLSDKLFPNATVTEPTSTVPLEWNFAVLVVSRDATESIRRLDVEDWGTLVIMPHNSRDHRFRQLDLEMTLRHWQSHIRASLGLAINFNMQAEHEVMSRHDTQRFHIQRKPDQLMLDWEARRLEEELLRSRYHLSLRTLHAIQRLSEELPDLKITSEMVTTFKDCAHKLHDISEFLARNDFSDSRHLYQATLAAHWAQKRSADVEAHPDSQASSFFSLEWKAGVFLPLAVPIAATVLGLLALEINESVLTVEKEDYHTFVVKED